MNPLVVVIILLWLVHANSSYIISTIAGNGATGNIGNIGDGSSSTSAKVKSPRGLFLDSSGNVYIADSGHQTVRKITVATGIISSVAGTGGRSTQATSTNGDGGSATSATFNDLYDIYVDSSSNIYIGDR